MVERCTFMKAFGESSLKVLIILVIVTWPLSEQRCRSEWLSVRIILGLDYHIWHKLCLEGDIYKKKCLEINTKKLKIFGISY